MSRKCVTFQEGYKLHITSLKMPRVSHYFSPECHLVRQSWQLKTCTGRTKKKKKRSPLFLDISRAENESQYKGILSVTDALSATANGTFPWASSIHPLGGPAPLRSVARFLFSRPTRERERERERERDKMDADVTVLAGVTDGLIIQTHPSGRRKTQHLAC